MKPMLAATALCADILFPVYASPKLDGVRGIITANGKLLSRSLKRFRNPHVNRLFDDARLAGLDGELIAGDPGAPDVYRVTNGACQREAGSPDVQFYAFDIWDCASSFEVRLHFLSRMKLPKHVHVLEQVLVRDEKQLLAYEENVLAAGFEGLILRSPLAEYKYGRSRLSEQGMMKLKRFQDSEAEVIGVEEEMHNANEAKKNELGRTQRSSAKAGLVGTGRMGALNVRDLHTGVEFSIGSGFTAEDRLDLWKVGDIVKYKSFSIGVKDKPRFPIFLGRRMKEDMS